MLDLLLMMGVLAGSAVLGFITIRRIPPMLHTPLMSMTNAISGVVLLGALVLFAWPGHAVHRLLGAVALAAAAFNLAGGFAITDRMLSFFRRKTPSDREAQVE